MLQETELHPHSFSQLDSRSRGRGQNTFAAYAWRSNTNSFVYQGVYRKREHLTLIGTAAAVESCLVVATRPSVAKPERRSRCYAVFPYGDGVAAVQVLRDWIQRPPAVD